MLKGKTIITTCAINKANKIENLLTAKGALVKKFPLIEISPAIINTSIKNTFKNIHNYGWIILTSTNGVKYFFRCAKELKVDFNNKSMKFAVIGKATQKALESLGFTANFYPNSGNSVEFAHQLNEFLGNSNQNILWPTSNIAMKNISSIVGTKHQLTKLSIYTSKEISPNKQKLIELVKSDNYETILFLSPSAIRSFLAIFGKINVKNIRCLPIGTTTNQELINAGITALFVPSIPNIETMISELEEYLITKIKN